MGAHIPVLEAQPDLLDNDPQEDMLSLTILWPMFQSALGLGSSWVLQIMSQPSPLMALSVLPEGS